MYNRLKATLGQSVGICHGTSVQKVAEDERWDGRGIMAKRLIFGTFMTPTNNATIINFYFHFLTGVTGKW
jgi:hypothetical protein